MVWWGLMGSASARVRALNKTLRTNTLACQPALWVKPPPAASPSAPTLGLLVLRSVGEAAIARLSKAMPATSRLSPSKLGVRPAVHR